MWQVTYDHYGSGRKVNVQSPGYDAERANRECIYKFRLRDDDGEVYFTGYSNMNDSFAPLDDYGRAFGCTDIQYQNAANQWETL